MNAARFLLAAVAAMLPALAGAEAVMIRGATVHTMGEAGTLENTDILVSGTVVQRIGQNLPVPADIRVFEAQGRPVTPGLFAGVTSIGIGEVNGVPESMDQGNAMPEMRPEFDVSLAFNPNSAWLPIVRNEGLTFTMLEAGPGGNIVNGRGRVVGLDGGYRSFYGPGALFINIGRDASALSGGSRAAQWMLLAQAVSESTQEPQGERHALLTPDGRTILKRLASDGTVVFDVQRASDIVTAIRFARNQGWRPVILGGAEAWMIAPELAQQKVPVLLDPLLNLPGNFDELGARLDNAALLHAAGVTVVINATSSRTSIKPRQLAGNAVANGLPWSAALAALTINPARVFSADGMFGSIEKGKRADLVMWSGDPLEVTTFAELVIVNGEVDSGRSRQTDLLERYLPENPAMPRAYIKPSGTRPASGTGSPADGETP